MSWQDVTIYPLLRCQGVWNKTCTQLSLSQIFFQNPKNDSLGDVQRFCYHSWCDSTVIFYHISTSSNVYRSSSRFWRATSLVIYQISSISKSRIPPKKRLIGSQPHSHKPFAPILVFLLQRDRLWNKSLWQRSVHFLSMTLQVINRTQSKINIWNSACERMLLGSRLVDRLL